MTPLPLIPVILGGASVIAGAVGVKKGVDAKKDMDSAKRINSSSEQLAKEAENFILLAKKDTTKAIEKLGLKKIQLLSTTIKDFVEIFEQIKNIELQETEGINELKYFKPGSESFQSLKTASYEASQVAINGLAAIGSGALLAYGTYSAVMGGLGGLLVTATTGTALTTLSGAAATNATLAWLGGGALKAGGLGMAGGMTVLGGLVAGPALALGGALFASQAKTALNDAHGNYEKAKAFKQQAKNIGVTLKGIYTRATQLTNLLDGLNKYLVRYNVIMYHTLETSGKEWSRYSESEKQNIYKCAQIAMTIKTILDAPLLKQEGELDSKSLKVLKQGEQYLQQLNQL